MEILHRIEDVRTESTEFLSLLSSETHLIHLDGTAAHRNHEIRIALIRACAKRKFMLCPVTALSSKFAACNPFSVMHQTNLKHSVALGIDISFEHISAANRLRTLTNTGKVST